MTRYVSWIAGAPVQHIGLNKYRYETNSIGATYICDHSAEHLDLTRFEIWQGDSQHAGVERIELDGYQQSITNGSGDELWISDIFMMEAGYTNNAAWTVVGQIKSADTGVKSAPACNFNLDPASGGRRLQLMRRNWTEPSGPLVNTVMWTFDLELGKKYRRVLRFKPDPTGGTGIIQMWFGEYVEGQTNTSIPKLVDYVGNVGISTSTGYYWKFGLYRAESGNNNRVAAQYANVEVSKGSLLLRVDNALPIVRILPSTL